MTGTLRLTVSTVASSKRSQKPLVKYIKNGGTKKNIRGRRDIKEMNRSETDWPAVFLVGGLIWFMIAILHLTFF